MRAIYTTLLILGSCFLGWTPAILIYTLTCRTGCYIRGEDLLMINCKHTSLILSIRCVENILVALKMLANPIIYSIRMREIKVKLNFSRRSEISTKKKLTGWHPSNVLRNRRVFLQISQKRLRIRILLQIQNEEQHRGRYHTSTSNFDEKRQRQPHWRGEHFFVISVAHFLSWITLYSINGSNFNDCDFLEPQGICNFKN